MRDDQNNSQSLEMLGSDQQQVSQEQSEFYVDPNSSNQGMQPTESELFPNSQAADDNSSSDGSGFNNKRPIIALLVLFLLGGMLFVFMPDQKTTKQIQKEEKAKIEVKKDDAIKTSTPINIPDDFNRVEVVAAAPKPLETLPISNPKPPEPPPAPTPTLPVAPAFPTNGGNPIPSFPTEIAPVNNQNTGLFSSKEEEEKKKKEMEARRKSAIIVIGGGESGGKSGADSASKDGKDEKDADGKAAEKSAEKKKTSEGFLGFGDGTLNEQVLTKTSSSQVKATYLGRLDSTIAQGKIIDAVLETAVNSDLPGTLRAIVSRDVYAESGKAVLIPKGSRVIGTYSVELKPGQSRVSVVWSRLIRPDGIDLALNSPGTDPLGRAGVTGFVDDKMLTKLATAFMISYIIPTIANKVANVNDRGITETQTKGTDGSTTTTTAGATVGSSQLQQSAKEFQDIAKKSFEDSFNTKSTIYVDQGARINIFVNQDVVFPPQIALNSMAKVVR
jgi:type IV secretion system protein VirB10